MDYIYVAVLILVLFNAMKNAKCDNEDIILMAGCNISLTWILPNTRKELLGLQIDSSNERQIASVSPDQKCHVRDNSSMRCSINSTDDRLIVVLNMFNVTAGQSGNYTIWKKTALQEQNSNNTFKKLVVIDGPDNVSLSREERHFYLKEHDIFVIDCLANCYPNCIFAWKGRVTIESQKLTIIFESNMTGQYACHVTNQQRNITLISDPITLHRAKEDEKPPDDNMKGFLSMGLVGVAVLLVVIGLLLLRQQRKNPSDKIDSQVLTELVVNLQTLTNGEISQGNSRIQNRPLPVLNTHELPITRRYRPHYLNQNRRSRSLHNLMDSTQDSFNPLRDGLSLQGLYSSTHTLDRSLMNGTQVNGPIKRRHLSNCDESQLDDMSRLENGNNLEFLYAKDRKDSATIRDKHSDETKSETLNNLQHVTFEEEPQENLYSTID